MQYMLVINTEDRLGEISVPAQVAEAITKAALQVDAVTNAQVIQIGTDLVQHQMP